MVNISVLTMVYKPTISGGAPPVWIIPSFPKPQEVGRVASAVVVAVCGEWKHGEWYRVNICSIMRVWCLSYNYNQLYVYIYMPEDVSEYMPEDMPDRMPDRMSEYLPEHMPEDMLDRMPERLPEDMSDRMAEDLPVRKSIHVMVGITRSKVYFCIESLIGSFPWSPDDSLGCAFQLGEVAIYDWKYSISN